MDTSTQNHKFHSRWISAITSLALAMIVNSTPTFAGAPKRQCDNLDLGTCPDPQKSDSETETTDSDGNRKLRVCDTAIYLPEQVPGVTPQTPSPVGPLPYMCLDCDGDGKKHKVYYHSENRVAQTLCYTMSLPPKPVEPLPPGVTPIIFLQLPVLPLPEKTYEPDKNVPCKVTIYVTSNDDC